MRTIFSIICFSLCVASASAIEPLKLTESSLGPINSKTKATLTQLKALFRGYKIQSEAFYLDGDPVGESFKVLQGEDLILEINANTADETYIFSVIIFDAKIKTPNGIHLGSKLEDLIALKILSTCKRGNEEVQNEVHCTAKNASNIEYSFPLSVEEETKTAVGEVIEIAIQPKRRLITGLSWHPPRKID